MLKLLWITFFIPTFCLAQNAHIPFARTLLEGGSEYDIYIDYMNTTSLTNYDGINTAIGDGLSYQKINAGANFKYGITSKLEGMLGANVRYIQSNVEFDGEIFSYTKAGFESAIIGFKYAFDEEDGMRYAIQGWYRQPMYSNEIFDATAERPDEIVLGDTGRDIAIGASFYNKTSSNNYLEGRALYRDPGAELSSEIFSHLQYSLVWKYMALNFGVENVYSLENDAYNNDELNKPVLFQGTSAGFNSINRQWTAPYIELNFALGDSWRIESQFAQIYTGNSTDLGPRLSFNLVKRKEASKALEKRVQKFKEYTVEGTVTKLSKSKKIAVVDIGLDVGLRKGMKVDFYYFDFRGGNILIGSGTVVKAGASKSLVHIKQRNGRRRIKEGTVIRSGEIKE